MKIEIKSTKDYSIFKIIDTNRVIDKSNINAIKKSMRNKFRIVPILVNENHQVIDGQHRLFACISLGLPVYYYSVSGYAIKDVRALNSTNKKWGVVDYVNSRAKDGEETYSKFLDFMEEYCFSATTAKIFLTGNAGSSSIKHGTMKLSEHDFRKAHVLARKFKILADLVGKGWHASHFASGFCEAISLDGFDFDYFIKRIKQSPSKLRDILSSGSSRKGFKLALIRAYNQNTPTNKRVGYIDYVD